MALGPVSGYASEWFALGPYGGDARSITADPHDAKHLYLGTANGWVYQSHDGGLQWQRLAQIGKRNDLVIDHLLVDASNPKRLMVGAWIIDHPDGGLYISDDGGHTWYSQAQMRGQSIRSMARSASDPNEIVAGTLKGVYRSMDNGIHWTQISPAGSAEIHEVQSVAIDPDNGDVIYAGTWHLPWKTTDGGAHWTNITHAQGLIDDSDVFSIIVDSEKSKVVYLSACSGIYKSEDFGELFRKVQGIPNEARRTRKLAQDPTDQRTVFAGTTEGLYRTLDAGAHWDRLTPGDVVVNDVFIDPANSNHVLLATDHGGVLRSEDGGTTFQASNTGFSARQVTAYTADPQLPADVYVGVVNDKTTGGVFASHDGGVHWEQDADGLGGRDVFSLLALQDGTKLAGTEHGLFRLQDGTWADSGSVVAQAAAPVHPHHVAAKPVVHPKTKAAARAAAGRAAAARREQAAREQAAAHATPAAGHLDNPVYALAAMGDQVFAGTASGLFLSGDEGRTWSAVSAVAIPDARFVAVANKIVLAATLKRLELSLDAGATWDAVALPPDLTQIGAVAVDELGNLWVGGREGVYYSPDYGVTWKTLRNLFITQVDGIYFDAPAHRVLVTSMSSTFAFAVSLPSYAVKYWDSGWNLRFVRPVGDHLIGATLFDGMVVQPRMVDSAFENGK